MCGRFSLAGDPFELGFKDNFNISPSTSIPVKTIDCDGQLMKWSYSPSWKPDMNLINCRSETIAEKPSFKGAKRCIIPFSGWYEWQKREDAKVPYYHYSDAKYFAGIFNDSGCCILTRESADTLSHIHHRHLYMHLFQEKISNLKIISIRFINFLKNQPKGPKTSQLRARA